MTQRAYLAFETGGTKLVAAVATSDGKLIESRVLDRPQTNRAPQSLRQLVDVALRLREDYESRDYAFAGIGFGYGGQVSRSAQRVLRCPHEDGWEDVDVRDELRRSFDLPAVIENDCKLAALAEAHLGAGHGHRTAFYLTIGTGIGGGIVRDGWIADFDDLGEAEIGHIVVAAHDGLKCPCGNTGCLEAMCSGPGLAALAKHLANRDAGDWQGNNTAQRAIHDKRFTAKDLLDAWDADDVFASVIVRVATRYFGYALGTVIQIVNPNVMIFGGGVGANNERFVQRAHEETLQFVMPNLRGRCQFVRSQLRENVVTQGAALLAAQAFTL